MALRLVGVVGVLAIAASCASADSGVTADRSMSTAGPETTSTTTSLPVGDDVASDGDGVGDALFPALGNPGIDVLDYDVDLDYDPSTSEIAATVTLTIAFADDRDEFTLDAVGLDITSVTIDGADTPFIVEPEELRIDPPTILRRGTTTKVTIDYTVTPQPLDGADGVPVGWFATEAGSYVLNEPDGARTWLPSNDHPSDRAAWTFTIRVPSGTTAVANGALTSETDDGVTATWVWQQDDEMPTYLILLLTGDYQLVDGVSPTGVPMQSAFVRGVDDWEQKYTDLTIEQLDYFDDLFGPYPLSSYGIAVTDSDPGLAMETMGRSMFSAVDLGGSLAYGPQLLLAHELAHQWFGNTVTLGRWQDIWLNESFATYGEWLWLDHEDLASIDDLAQTALDERRSSGGTGPTSPTAESLFGPDSYGGGATVLHALRVTIGDDAFFALLRRWVAEHRFGSATTDDFVALAEQVAGRDLERFFDDWLFTADPPPAFPTLS